MNSLHVRPYRRGDRAACLSLCEGNVPDFFFPHEVPGFAEFLDELTGPYLVVEGAGGRVVACGGLALEPPDVALCWGMVRRDCQRQGIGRVLLQARLILAAKTPDVRKVNLNTAQLTAAFYAKAGFTTHRVLADFYGPGLHRHDMDLRLGPARRAIIATYPDPFTSGQHSQSE